MLSTPSERLHHRVRKLGLTHRQMVHVQKPIARTRKLIALAVRRCDVDHVDAQVLYVLDRRNEIGVARYQHRTIERAFACVMSHCDGDVDIGELLLRPLPRVTTFGALHSSRHEASFGDLQPSVRPQCTEVVNLPRTRLERSVHHRCEVSDRQLVVSNKARGKGGPIKPPAVVEPCGAQTVVGIESVDVNRRSTLRSFDSFYDVVDNNSITAGHTVFTPGLPVQTALRFGRGPVFFFCPVRPCRSGTSTR
jgi:hypothetical protein